MPRQCPTCAQRAPRQCPSDPFQRTSGLSVCPPFAQACSEDPEGCESDWQIGQGAGRVDGPYAQKRLGGLVHIELLLQDVLDSEVEGDVIEAGCFMGGTAVFMRAGESVSE